MRVIHVAPTQFGRGGLLGGGERYPLELARELKAPPARTRVIYGGADPRRFYPDPSASRDGVLFVGRITPHKGIDRLIAALPMGAHLKVVGSAGHDPRPPERDYPRLLRRL